MINQIQNAEAETPRRKKSLNIIAKDLTILDSTVELLASKGLADLNFSTVANFSGVSYTAVGNRYKNIEQLIADVWVQRSQDQLLSEFDQVIALYLDSETKDYETRINRLRQLFQTSSLTQATAEILTGVRSDSAAFSAVSRYLTTSLKNAKHISPVRAAQVSILWQLLLGVLVGKRNIAYENVDFFDILDQHAIAVRTTGEPRELPDVNSQFLGDFEFSTGDGNTDKLLLSCLLNVGKFGFERVTTKQIAADAGVSEGALFARFPTKIALFIEAAKRQAQMGYAANQKFLEDTTQQYGASDSQCIYVREIQKAGIELQRNIFLERVRLAWHHANLRDAENSALDEHLRSIGAQSLTEESMLNPAWFLALSFSIGTILLAQLSPGCNELPYSAVPGFFDLD